MPPLTDFDELAGTDRGRRDHGSGTGGRRRSGRVAAQPPRGPVVDCDASQASASTSRCRSRAQRRARGAHRWFTLPIRRSPAHRRRSADAGGAGRAEGVSDHAHQPRLGFRRRGTRGARGAGRGASLRGATGRTARDCCRASSRSTWSAPCLRARERTGGSSSAVCSPSCRCRLQSLDAGVFLGHAAVVQVRCGSRVRVSAVRSLFREGGIVRLARPSRANCAPSEAVGAPPRSAVPTSSTERRSGCPRGWSADGHRIGTVAGVIAAIEAITAS